MKKVYLLIILFSTLRMGEALGQGIYFSQSQLTPLLYNPAAPALKDEASLMLNYRNQQSSSQLSLQTLSFNGMLPLYNKDRSRRWGGVGIGVLSDKAEDIGSLVNQQAMGSFACNIPVFGSNFLALGAQGAWGQQRFGLEHVATGSQWVTNKGYDPSAGTGEELLQDRKSFWSLGGGVLFYQENEKGEIRYQLGASAYHLNKPELSFLNEQVFQAVSYRAHASLHIPSGRKFAVIPELSWQQQARQQLLGIGSVVQYKFDNDNPFDPIGSGSLNFLAKANINEALVFGIQLHQPSYVVGFSYDWGFASSRYNEPGYHAAEFAIALRKPIGRKPKTTTLPSNSIGEVREFFVEKEIAVVENSTAEAPVAGGAGSEIDKRPVYSGKSVQFELKKDFKFAFNKADLDSEAKLYLDDLYELLQYNPQLKLKVLGHTDEIGSRKANQEVSERRALAVQEYLIWKGLAVERIRAEGKGASEPLLPNSTEENRAKNRRVEFILYTP